MKKKGLILVSLGLLAGLVFGVGVLWVKSYIAQQLVELLDDEARDSAHCNFKSDKIQISLLSLRAYTSNAGIFCDGEPRLWFKKLRASFSLAKIREHKVLLSQLDLFDGFSKGFGPESATYKFIDDLSAPLAPERDYPGRWKVKLQKLKLHNSEISEQFSFGSLVGSGSELLVVRTPDNNFNLTPSIRSLTLNTGASNGAAKRQLMLGSLSGELFLADDHIDFKKIALNLNKSALQISARADKAPAEKLKGEILARLDALSLNLPDWIKLSLSAGGSLSGKLSEPRAALSLDPSASSAAVSSGTSDLLTLDKTSGSIQLESKDDQLHILLENFNAQGPHASVSNPAALELKSNKLSGSLKIRADALSLASLGLHDLDLGLNLSGDLTAPHLTLSGSLGSITSQGYGFGPFNLNSEYHADKLGFELNGQAALKGKLHAKGSLKFSKDGVNLEDAGFEISDLHPAELGKHLELVPSSLAINGTGNINSDPKKSEISGNAKFRLSLAPGVSNDLSAIADFKGNQISLKLGNQSGSLSSDLNLRLGSSEKSSLKIALKKFSTADLFPNEQCSEFSLDANYDFGLALFDSGSGQVKIDQISVGCEPYNLKTSQAYKLELKEGSLVIPAFEMRGSDSQLALAGQVSLSKGYDIKANGNLNLNSFLALTPSFDELSGNVHLASQISGPLSSPLFNGETTLTDGIISIASANIDVTEIHSKILMSGSNWKIGELSGKINQGDFTVDGSILPLDISRSELNIKLDKVLLEPAENTSLVFSGDLTLNHSGPGNPLIAGKLEIDNAEFQKNIDIGTLLRAVVGYAIPSSRKTGGLGALPPIDLNLKIEAPNNIFVFTNWLGAELQANLTITGQLDSPQIDGHLETLSGWFGFRERRFEINSGLIEFKPNLPQPNLEIVSEAAVRSITGDNLLVVLEARGPLSSPKISLSSDSGLSQKEILALLTASSNLSSDTRSAEVRTGIELGQFPLFRDEQSYLVGKFLKNLTTIDSITLEPTYNVQRSAIEPTIIANKRLSQSLALIGESFFGSSVNEQNLKLRYTLTPKLNLSAILNSISTRKNTAAGTDLTYTVLAQQKKTLDIEVKGNSHFDDWEILQGVRLSERTNLESKNLPKLQKQIERFYISSGYFGIKVDLECRSEGEYCSKLTINLLEGRAGRIEGLKYEGDQLPEKFDSALKGEIQDKPPATQETLNRIEKTLIVGLRNEGFIGARIKAQYAESDSESNRTLLLKVKIGAPVSFSFRGNKIFNASDFLDSINLFTRKQPFGNNTINILLEGIERKYREAGYLFVALTNQKEVDDEGRTNYIVDIDEGRAIAVKAVNLEGSDLSRKEAEQLVAGSKPEIYDSFFRPKFAVAEEIDANAEALKVLLIDHGHPDAEVNYQIVPNAEQSSVEISYTISLGESQQVKAIQFEGLPEDLPPPAVPSELTVSATNLLLENLVDDLHAKGYVHSSFHSMLDTASRTLKVSVQPGKPVTIGEIRFEGSQTIKSEVISRNLDFKPGDRWDNEKINSTRRKLLKLGLFSRAEIAAASGELNNQVEDVVVRVNERALRSLEVGTGVNSEFGYHLFGEATDRQFFADGRSLSLRLDTYYRARLQSITQGVASLKYLDPYFLNSDYSLVEDLRYQKISISTQEFDLDRVSLASYIYRSFDDGISYSLGHTLLQDQLSNVSPESILDSSLDTGTVRVSFLGGSFAYDQRDNPLNPLKGYNLNLDYQVAWDGIGSDANYYSLGGRFSFILPLRLLGPRFSLANNIRASAAWTFSDTDQIPIAQRFYLGGRGSVRGFRENSIGPRGPDGSIIGGDTLYSDNLELRYLLGENTSLLTFLDTGRVFIRDMHFPYDDLRVSAGVGIRYLSPIGPIGLDVGHPLDEKSGEPSVRVHFNIGTNF